MVGARMLVILECPIQPETAVQTALRAIAAARSPFGLRFAVPSFCEDIFTEARQAESSLRREDILFYDEGLGLTAIKPLLTDEAYFLSLIGAYDFIEDWDAALYARYKKTPSSSALMTGAVEAPTEDIGAECYLPALAEDFEPNGVRIRHGLPLVCSAAPVETLVIDPMLLFGTIRVFKRMDMRRETLSFAAYAAGIRVYALDRAVLWPIDPTPERRLLRPAEEALPGTTPARFEQLAGFRYDMKRAGVRTTWGLFGLGDSYAQRLPTPLVISQRTSALLSRARRQNLPLCVTALVDLPDAKKPMPVYVLRYGFMRALSNLPLMIYTGGSQERFIRANDANAWAYPEGDALPYQMMEKGLTEYQRFGRSKLLILRHAAKRHIEFTHVAWVNADTLPHPICPDATPDFSALMDDTIHMATVDGVPDCSFMTLPIKLLGLMAEEIDATTQFDIDLKRDLSEQAMMTRIIERHPRMFTLHPMPEKHLLMLTTFEPTLLSQRYRALLRGISPVDMPQPE